MLRILQEELAEGAIDAAVDRIAGGEPLQYVIGKACFGDFELHLDHRVLIPRPETEELVAWVREEMGEGKRVLDIGTGSGAIALSLADHAEVWAIDVSAGALAVARSNADALGLELHFHQADILDPGTWAQWPEPDIIVANPPYIPYKEWEGLEEHVRLHEPELALAVPDEDPLRFYHAILAYAVSRDQQPVCYLELHEGMGEAFRSLVQDMGMGEAELRKDLSGRVRMGKVEP